LDHAGEGAAFLLREDALQLGCHALGIGDLQREQAERHAGHPIDVEGGNEVFDVLGLRSRADEDNQIPGRIDAQHPARRHERLDDFTKRSRRSVLQGNDVQSEPPLDAYGFGAAHDLRRRRRILDRHDLIETAAFDDGDAVHGQNVLEHADHLVS
jgi:hypothetical protein